jgi:formylglycine-generating enzyme required for sulfatase activity
MTLCACAPKTRDCAVCPEMVHVDGGRFQMGSPPGDRQAYEQPVHEVTVGPFSMSRFEIRFDEWDACVADRGCQTGVHDHGWGRGAMPVYNVQWDDAQDYVRWLSRTSGGKHYRLPTEAEWEYAARAGSAARYAWGSEMEMGHAVCFSECGPEADQPAKGGTTAPNAFGLYDLHGNLWEWVQDCWHGNYEGAPVDGSAWESSKNVCEQRVIRGGSWNCLPFDVRSATRSSMPQTVRYNTVGIRVVRED